MSATETLAVTTVNHWINGKQEAATSGRSGIVRDPATGDAIAEVGFATVADVDRAVAAAKAACARVARRLRCRAAPRCCSGCAS